MIIDFSEEFLEQNLLDVFNIARERGLKNVEIRISRNILRGQDEKDKKGTVKLWVNGKDRFFCRSLTNLKEALEDHKDLKWMNEKLKSLP